MHEEIKKRIVIASVLKPVDDTRMFGKIGTSLAEQANYDVVIIGAKGSAQQVPSRYIELGTIERFSWKRIFAPIKVLQHVLRIKPHIFIITTHELLWASLLAKLFTGCKIIYDIQENYFYNILYTDSFPPVARQVVALYVRLKEKITSYFIDHFFLAEQAYERELTFIEKKYTILPNRIKKPTTVHLQKKRGEIFKLIFSGTLADSTGVFIAIDIAEGLHRIDSRFSLTIIGFCSKAEVLEKIRNRIENKSFINLIGGNTLVPHQEIVQQILLADAGIIAYPPNRSTETSVPTKLFEYLGYRLPVILISHRPWINICEPYQAAVVFDHSNINFLQLRKQLLVKPFYSTLPENEQYWDEEAEKLKIVIRNL